jgi:uncharacterized membrane protein
VYPALLLLSFFTLRANAFDLSVFDYALWTAHEGPVAGFVPFFGHTLQAHHFMPTLFLLTPLHWVWPSPVLLILLQCAAVAVAAILLARIALEHVPPLAASAIVLAFLASRKAHSAVISTFYIESFEPALIFGFVWAAAARRWAWYWPLVGLALGCKEDVAIYVALFGVLLAVDRRTRLQGALTVVAATVWLAVAVGVAIPHAREASGLPAANPFIEARYGEPGAVGERLASARAVSKLAGLLAATAMLCLVAPRYLVVAIPGVLLNLAATRESLQAGLVGHYLWPILPWVFLATIEGVKRVRWYSPRVATLWLAGLAALTVLDSPLSLQSVRSLLQDADAARIVRAELAQVPPDRSVLAQPQLIPHLPKRTRIQALGREVSSEAGADTILLCGLGDQWPLTAADFEAKVAWFTAHPEYRRDHQVRRPLVRFDRPADAAGRR